MIMKIRLTEKQMARFAALVREARPWTCRENSTYKSRLVPYYDVTINDDDNAAAEMIREAKLCK